MEAEILYQRGVGEQARYFFKHALIQDTAYQSLLKSTRQQYHQQIAQVLEERFPDIKENQPELLAHHYTEAGLIEQAIPYWQQAGQKASQRSANAEAISHLSKGIELLKTLPDIPERPQQELTLQLALGVARQAADGHAASEVEAAYARALTLCRQIGEVPQLFPVLFGLQRFYTVRVEFQVACELGEQLLRLAQRVQDPGLLLEAHFAVGRTLLLLGKHTSAREHLEQGIALYDPQQHHSHAFLYGQDPGMLCQTYEASALWFLGYPNQALKVIGEALTLGRELSHSHSLAGTLNSAAMHHQIRRERQVVQERVEESITLSTEQGFPPFSAQGDNLEGLGTGRTGMGRRRYYPDTPGFGCLSGHRSRAVPNILSCPTG